MLVGAMSWDVWAIGVFPSVDSRRGRAGAFLRHRNFPARSYFFTISFACVCVNVRALGCSSENLILRYMVGDAIGNGALPRPSSGGCLMGTTAIVR